MMTTGAEARPSARGTHLRWIQRVLFATGIVCFGYCLFVLADAALFGAVQERQLERALREGPEVSGPSPSFVAGVRRRLPPPVRPGGLIGRLEVPRLGLRLMVAEGADHRTLGRAVGHLPESALPGQEGNVALAGHRDTFFRSLEKIRPGDELRLVTPAGSFQYRVEATTVVNPGRTEVLDPTATPSLTLITCYPFYFVGPAPGRFVVRARQVTGLAAVYSRG